MKNKTRRRRKKWTPVATRIPRRTVQDLPDQLLHNIIQRLGCHVSIVRAAAVCKRWRRIASAHSVGRRWNVPIRSDFATCIGHYYVADPSSSSRAQRCRHDFVPASPTIINPRHFFLDFVPAAPSGRPWEIVDGYGTVLLLACQRARRGFFFFPDLVVCEPISRSYVRIKPIPEMKYFRCIGAFLGYYWNSNVITMSTFKVTCVLYDSVGGMDEDGGIVVTARVYKHPGTYSMSSRLKDGWDMSRAACRSIHIDGAQFARYAGRIWWGARTIFVDVGDAGAGNLLTLREYSGEFWHFPLPDHVRAESTNNAVFRLLEGEYVDPFMIVRLIGEELSVFVHQQLDDGASQWVHEKSLLLREATRGLPGYKDCYFSRPAKIVTAKDGYVVLTPAEETWLLSVELQTMEVERDDSIDVYAYELYTRPKVKACLVKCKRNNSNSCFDFCKCE